mmetsp:Transcript_43047/g.125185  ORF Transcript_43047/g.125185 Transcript_43047/m.125185 type:complete len:118 (+) Transcript_43047:63-416(+)|eukprot:CAMPEP_0170304032 /NCGR_PEP_ID=MMETSP0116_2-20130129/52351_1 /TAXON_ID=400756 /ORGANISM="Durinskia baltica, Strain CSIRO CS-38" /LENGTH=117 /DNA_ID=CAMNT_0010556005 /DNA_START=58 /DNA_END=411 /DNA_ORIENTATION=-
MAQWVLAFRATARHNIPARNLRCALTLGSIVIFFIYGMLYLASVMGIVSARSELMFVLTFNFGAKLIFIVAFLGIRVSQFYDLLVALVRRKVLPFDQLLPNDFEALDADDDEMPGMD